ncbi:MAG: serine/threonine-protein phosphatase [Clostridia bacterium]|nr:serine/threonine-protein phosphatase [Clostridia bacterium]
MKYTVSYSCLSHVGRVRSKNQDNYYCAGAVRPLCETSPEPVIGRVSPKNEVLFAVFDGMGGEEKGEVASLIAAGCAENMTVRDDTVTALSELCQSANDTVCAYAAENGGLSMGTTAAMLLFSKDSITLCNIGDSKIFRLSRGKLFQISRDHLGVSAFGKRPPLLQYLGISPENLVIEPHFSVGDIVDGDRYLICTDGLTDHVTPEQIAYILGGSIEGASGELVECALKGGGKDNVTVIALEIRKNKFFDIFRKGEK